MTPLGAIVWNKSIAKSVLGSPVIGASRVYVGGTDGFVRAIDPATGALRWSFKVGGPIFGGLAIGDDGTLYFGAGDRRVYALRDTGPLAQLRWVRQVPTRIQSTPAVDRSGGVFIGSDDGNVYGLDGATGTIRWTFSTTNCGEVESAIAIGIGGRVFVGSEHSLYAIGEFRSGQDCWSDAFIDPTGLTPDEITRRWQILLAACGGPSVNACGSFVQGTVNADRFLAAQKIAAQQITPAQYLAIVRDRTRKFDALTANGGARLCDPAGGDADGDLVGDRFDACPNTPPLTPTLDNGCTDSTLPEAPDATLIHDGLEKMNFLLDARCDETVPEIPSLALIAAHFGGVDFDNSTEKEFWFSGIDNQRPGCDVFYEMDVLYRGGDGHTESYYLVFPRTRGECQTQLKSGW